MRTGNSLPPEDVLLERILSLCKDHQITVKSLEQELGFGNGTIRRWGNSIPAVYAVGKAAQYFGVSVDYLIGLTDIQTPVDVMIRDKDISSLLHVFSKASSSDRVRMIATLRVAFDSAFTDEYTVATNEFLKIFEGEDSNGIAETKND